MIPLVAKSWLARPLRCFEKIRPARSLIRYSSHPRGHLRLHPPNYGSQVVIGMFYRPAGPRPSQMCDLIFDIEQFQTGLGSELRSQAKPGGASGPLIYREPVGI